MEIIVVRGGGDIATGICHRLFRAGFNVLILDIEKPTAIRRAVAFSEAIYSKEIEVEGVRAVHVDRIEDIFHEINKGNIPVYIDPTGKCIDEISPLAVVDAILAKRNLGTHMDMAPITIGIGPGFEAGVDVDLVIETKRGHFLGKVIHEGPAIANTSIPGDILGHTEDRIIRATAEGQVMPLIEIGDMVEKGQLICKIGDTQVIANISGIVRGMIKEGLFVAKGYKIGDIDPRGERENVFTISEKARAVGGGVLEAIMYMKNGGLD